MKQKNILPLLCLLCLLATAQLQAQQHAMNAMNERKKKTFSLNNEQKIQNEIERLRAEKETKEQ